jgi:hypothetical protein
MVELERLAAEAEIAMNGDVTGLHLPTLCRMLA